MDANVEAIWDASGCPQWGQKRAGRSRLTDVPQLPQVRAATSIDVEP